MERKPARSLLQLVQTPPELNNFLKRYVVQVNTEEALTLFWARAEVGPPIEGDEGGKRQAFRYGGKLFIWVAGVTTDSYNDDFPVKEVAPALGACA